MTAARGSEPLELARDRILAKLTSPDARLAHSMAAGVLRHRTQLDARIRPFVKKKWRHVPTPLKDVLRLGAFQIDYLDRVPSYAAVSSAVSLARELRGPRAGAFVNAVLRRVSECPPPEPGDKPGREDLALRYSHPSWLVSRWLERWDRADTEALLQHNNRLPEIYLSALNWSLQQIIDAFEREDIEFRLLEEGTSVAVRSTRVPDLPGYADGAFIVQDPAQTRVLEFAEFEPDVPVWDACAAPGGKTVTLAATRSVLATELDPRRLPRLKENLERSRRVALVVRADARRPPLREGSQRGVLLDVPCTATGTFQRHPDARWRLNQSMLHKAAELQRELLDAAVSVVADRGVLVYATCSLEPEENSGQVDYFLERHPEFRRSKPDLEIFPPDAKSDGAYAARLVRLR